jgi:hypothetical protein
MPVIKNYGFLWQRRHIVLGGGAGKSGQLRGWRKGNKKVHVDFRTQFGVYALYDDNSKIVYIGQAGNGRADLYKRLKQHMKSSNLWNRWTQFSWVGFKAVNKKGSLSAKQSVTAHVGGFTYSAALNEIEGILIELVEPNLNKQGGRLKGAKEFFQVVPKEACTLEDVHEGVKRLEKLIKKMKS